MKKAKETKEEIGHDEESGMYDHATAKQTIVPSGTLTGLRQLRGWTKNLVKDLCLLPGLEQEGITFCLRPRPVGVNVTLIYHRLNNRRKKGDPRHGSFTEAYFANPLPEECAESELYYLLKSISPQIVQWPDDWGRYRAFDGIVVVPKEIWEEARLAYKKERAFCSSFAQEEKDTLFVSPREMVAQILHERYWREDVDTYSERFAFIRHTMRYQPPSTPIERAIFNPDFNPQFKTVALKDLEEELLAYSNSIIQKKWMLDGLVIEGVEVTINNPPLQALTKFPSILFRPRKRISSTVIGT